MKTILANFFVDGIGEIPGLFSLSHLLYVIIALGLISSLYLLSRKKKKEDLKKYIKIISIIVFGLEILKIIWNLTLREKVTYEDYVPLYLCSFFIYAALAFSFIKNEKSIIYRFARNFLFYGGISGGLAFIIFPTTALLVFPFLHILSIHSLIYHVLMVLVALWMLRIYEPTKHDFKNYFIILFVLELVIILINYALGSNFMMLNEPFGLAFFEFFYELIKPIYPFAMGIGQCLVTFMFGIIISRIYNTLVKKL